MSVLLVDTVNTWNSGAWNRSVVDRSVTVTGVSLSTTLRSIEATIPGTAFVTNVGISLSFVCSYSGTQVYLLQSKYSLV